MAAAAWLALALAGEPGTAHPGWPDSRREDLLEPRAPDWPEDWFGDMPARTAIGVVTEAGEPVTRRAAATTDGFLLTAAEGGEGQGETMEAGGATPAEGAVAAHDLLETACTVATGPGGFWEAVAGANIRLRLDADSEMDLRQYAVLPEGGCRLETMLRAGALRIRVAENALAPDSVAVYTGGLEVLLRRGDVVFLATAPAGTPPVEAAHAADAAAAAGRRRDIPGAGPGFGTGQAMILEGMAWFRRAATLARPEAGARPIMAAAGERALAPEDADSPPRILAPAEAAEAAEAWPGRLAFAAERERDSLPPIPRHLLGETDFKDSMDEDSP